MEGKRRWSHLTARWKSSIIPKRIDPHYPQVKDRLSWRKSIYVDARNWKQLNLCRWHLIITCHLTHIERSSKKHSVIFFSWNQDITTPFHNLLNTQSKIYIVNLAKLVIDKYMQWLPHHFQNVYFASIYIKEHILYDLLHIFPALDVTLIDL